MKILCIICEQDIEEEKYPSHMEKQHPEGQVAAVQKQKAIKKNIPKASELPPGVKPEDLPTSEFMDTMAEIAREQEKPLVEAPVAQQNHPVVPTTIKPIRLTYKYTGDCDKGHGVSTLEMDVEKKHFVIAFCLQCNMQTESREVVDLDE